MNKLIFLILMTVFSSNVFAETLTIDITVPEINEQPYHRPYMAVWVETPERVGVHTITVWHKKKRWLKDLRQWWRKLGRDDPAAYDTVTKATPKPGSYQLSWDGKDASGKQLAAGDYFVCFEAVREDGGRNFTRQKIKLGSGAAQAYTLTAKVELGLIKINIK